MTTPTPDPDWPQPVPLVDLAGTPMRYIQEGPPHRCLHRIAPRMVTGEPTWVHYAACDNSMQPVPYDAGAQRYGWLVDQIEHATCWDCWKRSRNPDEIPAPSLRPSISTGKPRHLIVGQRGERFTPWPHQLGPWPQYVYMHACELGRAHHRRGGLGRLPFQDIFHDIATYNPDHATCERCLATTWTLAHLGALGNGLPLRVG